MGLGITFRLQGGMLAWVRGRALGDGPVPGSTAPTCNPHAPALQTSAAANPGPALILVLQPTLRVHLDLEHRRVLHGICHHASQRPIEHIPNLVHCWVTGGGVVGVLCVVWAKGDGGQVGDDAQLNTSLVCSYV